MQSIRIGYIRQAAFSCIISLALMMMAHCTGIIRRVCKGQGSAARDSSGYTHEVGKKGYRGRKMERGCGEF